MRGSPESGSDLQYFLVCPNPDPILGPLGGVYYFRMHVFEVPKTVRPNPDPILGPLGGVYYFRMHVFEVPKTICPDVQNANNNTHTSYAQADLGSSTQ